jgi:hypothetical protein
MNRTIDFCLGGAHFAVGESLMRFCCLEHPTYRVVSKSRQWASNQLADLTGQTWDKTGTCVPQLSAPAPQK